MVDYQVNHHIEILRQTSSLYFGKLVERRTLLVVELVERRDCILLDMARSLSAIFQRMWTVQLTLYPIGIPIPIC